MRDMFLSEDNLAAVDRLTELCRRLGPQHFGSWPSGGLVSNPAVATVICGATKPSQVASQRGCGRLGNVACSAVRDSCVGLIDQLSHRLRSMSSRGSGHLDFAYHFDVALD